MGEVVLDVVVVDRLRRRRGTVGVVSWWYE